jgi:mannan endo-1,6-alpha-mannosidase
VNVTDVANLTASQNSSIPAWNAHERVDFILQQSAKGAAKQCSGGENGTTCGSDWGRTEWDGTSGLGEDLSALNVILGNLRLSGKLATVNETAAASGSGAAGSSNGTTATGGGSGVNGSGAANGTTQSEGSASQFAVSSMVVVGAVGCLMGLL